MATHADRKHPGPALDMTALAEQVQGAVKAGAGSAFREHLARRDTSPALSYPVLTASQPIQQDMDGHTALALGVLNPNDLTIYWGIGGAIPQPGKRAIAQPARSLMVLPLMVGDILFGADAADLAAGDAPLYVMRFTCPQPCFLGAAA